jgi:two-component system sensor histidine kinase DegS
VAIEPGPLPLLEIAERARREIDLLTREIDDLEVLVSQARTEADHHERKRAQAEQEQATAGKVPGGERGDQLVALTKSSVIMAAQVDILEGKLKVLTRFRESLRRYSSELDHASMGGVVPEAVPDRLDMSAPLLPPAVSRLVLAAQEDLRREIARAMHDGPAQNLTNIVLEAQIVERLLDRDPAAARAEIGQLVEMVQHTLEATKTFIFDVRPMVLDDLGLVPTLRRVARDRGRRSHIPIEFESYGPDRRLPLDIESALFRLIDATVTGFLSCHPDRISIRVEWASDRTEACIAARRRQAEDLKEPEGENAVPAFTRGTAVEGDMPEALKAMIKDTDAAAIARAEGANQLLALPPNTWRDIQQRAATIGATAEMADEGREVILVLPAS